MSPDDQLFAVSVGPYKPLVHGGIETPVASAVEIRRIGNGRIVQKLPALAAKAGTFSVDSSTIAIGGQDGVVRLWQLRDGALLRTMQVPQSGDGNEYIGPMWQLQFSTDDRLLMTSDESGFVRVWRVADGTFVRSFKANYAALHPNGQVTFDQVLSTARQLPPHERARLIACLTEELVSPGQDDTTGNDAWERLKQIGADIAASPQVASV